ncbi:MAG TPA: alpha/beta fold hydrolase [Thermoanaerobaculia bacterium]
MHFTTTSHEGLPIRGNIDAPPDPSALVVIVHGFKGFKDWGFFPWLAEMLCDSGFAAVRFNMSRSGVGENLDTFDRLDLFAGDTYTAQLHDLHIAVAHAQRELPSLPTFLIGHSRGGGVALLGAREVHDLAGVVTWSAISRVDRWDDATKKRWRSDGTLSIENARTKQRMPLSTAMLDDVEAHGDRLDIGAATEALEVPLLVIHGGRDESVPVAEAETIASRGCDASKVVIANAGHTYNAIHPLVHVPFALDLAGLLTSRFIAAHD